MVPEAGRADAAEDFHFVVKESHCKGHAEYKLKSVAEFRREQGIEPCDAQNRLWIAILMKLASCQSIVGPFGAAPGEPAMRMFFMVSTDVDALRRFVFETRFPETNAVDPEAVEALKTDDEALLRRGFDWLKNVLINEPTIAMKNEVLQQAAAKARAGAG